MSMKPQPIPEIAAETIRVLRTAFPKGNLYIHLRDTLGTIYQDELFDDLYPGRGQQAFCGKLNEKMKRYNMRHAPGLYRRSEQYEVLN